MYCFKRCAQTGCGRPAFAECDRCLSHLPEPRRSIDQARSALVTRDVHRDLDFTGVELADLDLSGKRFYGCSFRGARLSRLKLANASLRLCFFDAATIEEVDWSGLDAQFCSFGTASIRKCRFAEAAILHVNFSGASIEDSSFSAANLYDSRFIRTSLVRVDFTDCDLKRVYLIPEREVEVSYKYSNTMEAVRDLEHLYL